ncbi:MAG: hypothetical protein GY853_09930 [PVC group bacterium]|nr:hypothetical protein [PVC group bacterium]
MENLTDYQLVQSFQLGNEQAFNVLFRKHETLLNIYSQKMYSFYRKYDFSKDWSHHFSELSNCFYKAVETCKLNKVNEETFVFKKRLYYYMRSYNQSLVKYFESKGRMIEIVEVDAKKANQRQHGYIQPILHTTCFNIFDQINNRMIIENLIEISGKVLNDVELKVFNMTIDNFTVEEMAEEMDFTKVYIYRIKKRIAKKLKKFL